VNLLVILMIAGCSDGITVVSTPTLTATKNAAFYDGHDSTALEAYAVAETRAKQWNKDAVLYQIPPTRSMVRNLGLPLDAVEKGWFFMFKVPGSPVEYYIAVAEGKLAGAIEAQPITLGEPVYKDQPINLAELPIQNSNVMQIFLEKGGKEYLATHPNPQFEFRLISIEGNPNPIWSLYDFNDPVTTLIHIDAVTGEEVEDPLPN
jgi:hypothetical protein